MKYFLYCLSFLFLAGCNNAGSHSSKYQTISFEETLSIQAPKDMVLEEERNGKYPFQVYLSGNKELELQFKLLDKFTANMAVLKNIYDKNLEDNDIELLESSIRQINGRTFLVHRSEGVNDNINYYSIQISTIYKTKIAFCLVRTLTKNKDIWEETMEEMLESIKLNTTMEAQ